ncbi:MAG: metallophosphoesterase [Methylovirgula sp.]|uniref:metallophosphoesterase n=1 Tax=Methylovirgula sp. TaxID=1978224 RepID=UPI0030767005
MAALEAEDPEAFHLWVFSDAHVATDKAVSDAIRNGMEFIPPAGYPESLANALRQSEFGSELGGPPFRWDIALDLGDNAGLWDLPDDRQGTEVVRQFGALKQHRREQIYPVAGNHDASPGDAESSRGKPANWWFRKWIDPLSENPDFSGVEAARRPYAFSHDE